MISMSGYGQTGPDPASSPTAPPRCRSPASRQLTGYDGWPPMHVGMSYGDPNAGLHAAFAVLSALFYRERTGEGQYIDMSQWESTMAVARRGIMDYTMNGEQPPRMGNRVRDMAPHGVFRCAPGDPRRGFPADDRWISIACATDEEWQALCGVMGRPELADRRPFRHPRRPQGQRRRPRRPRSRPGRSRRTRSRRCERSRPPASPPIRRW